MVSVPSLPKRRAFTEVFYRGCNPDIKDAVIPAPSHHWAHRARQGRTNGRVICSVAECSDC